MASKKRNKISIQMNDVDSMLKNQQTTTLDTSEMNGTRTIPLSVMTAKQDVLKREIRHSL